MLKVDVYLPDGKISGKIELPEALFGAKVNPDLMAQAVRVYLANQRKAKAKTKGRGEINLTTRKWFKQKGTGRARHGAKSAPIFVGGSKAHGPTGKENYSLKLSKKMRKVALASALTLKFKEGQIRIVDGLEKLEAKTKKASMVLSKLELSQGKIMVVTDGKIESILRAFRNLTDLKLSLLDQLNTYLVLNGGMLLFTKNAIKKLKGEEPVSEKMADNDKKKVEVKETKEKTKKMKSVNVVPVVKKKVSKVSVEKKASNGKK